MTAPETIPAQRPQGLDPLALLAGLVLDTGERWGAAALPFQRDDAEALLGTSGPRRHYLLRGRGMSKTSDVAALALALLLTEAPPRSRSYVYAVDGDQAAIFADTIAGFVARTPGLAGAVDVGARTVTVRSSGASLAVESSDGASALGTRPWLTVCDELGAWPSTANHRRLWAAVASATAKVPSARLLVIGTAGSPTGLGAEVWSEAETSPHWRTARRPGPAPWWTADDTDAVRSSLTASEWRRLILCEWAESDDALTTPEDVEACVRAGSTTLPARPGVEYVAALDVGTRRDLTALVVGHMEHRPAGRVVIVDRVLYWRPDRAAGGRVDLSEVEAATLRLCREYRVRRLRFDRMQAEQLTANLARAGVRPVEYVFSAAGTNRLARSLYVALRDRAVELPDDPEVRSELCAVRMVETGPGTVKMQNPPGTHDDVAVAVGMIVADLTERPTLGRGSVTVPRGSYARTNAGVRTSVPGREPVVPGSRHAALLARSRAAKMPRGLPGGAISGVPGAWDDPRR